MKKRKAHYDRKGQNVCGIYTVGSKYTPLKNRVTCKTCQKIMRRKSK